MEKLKIITFEEHASDKAIAEAGSKIVEKAFPNIRHMFDPAMTANPPEGTLFDFDKKRIADMDAAGVAMQIISYSNYTQWIPGNEATPLARDANDRLAAAVAAHPDRFGGFATLPWDAPEQAAKELERAVDTCHLQGALITGRPSTDAVFLDDARYTPVFEAAEQLRVPIYVHPGLPCRSLQKDYYGGFSPLVETSFSLYGWGWHAEAGIQIIRMILAGVFDKFPHLTIIAGHWGEMIPFFLDRLDMAMPKRMTGLKHEISEYFRKHVYVTPSGMFSYAQLRFTLDTVGADRILYSIDYPYINGNGAAKFLEDAPITPEEKEKIAHANAEELLKLHN